MCSDSVCACVFLFLSLYGDGDGGGRTNGFHKDRVRWTINRLQPFEWENNVKIVNVFSLSYSFCSVLKIYVYLRPNIAHGFPYLLRDRCSFQAFRLENLKNSWKKYQILEKLNFYIVVYDLQSSDKSQHNILFIKLLLPVEISNHVCNNCWTTKTMNYWTPKIIPEKYFISLIKAYRVCRPRYFITLLFFKLNGDVCFLLYVLLNAFSNYIRFFFLFFN